MGRAPRIEFPGAFYHVINRGDHLEPIFQGDTDRRSFLKTLAETCQSAGWLVHSFVLMRNHYHLLIETIRPTLVKGMQRLSSTYTRRYNLRHKTFGHLFQGRYKAILIDSNEPGHFLAVSDYIHLNPVRIGQTRSIAELMVHPWCSAAWLGRSRHRPTWLGWERLFGELGLHDASEISQEQYRHYLEQRIHGLAVEVGQVPETRSWCVGSDLFAEQAKSVLDQTRNVVPESWTGELADELEEDRARRLLMEGAQCLGYMDRYQIRGEDRFILGSWVRKRTRIGLRWLATELGLQTPGGLSNGIYLFERRLQTDLNLQNRFALLG